MRKANTRFESVDDYIRSAPRHVRKKLEELKRVIQEQAPQAQERISYQIPAFYLKGNLVYFAAWSTHIGFYATASGIRAFKKDLSKYKCSKGAVQFPLEEPLPMGLIRKIVRFRVKENRTKK